MKKRKSREHLSDIARMEFWPDALSAMMSIACDSLLLAGEESTREAINDFIESLPRCINDVQFTSE